MMTRVAFAAVALFATACTSPAETSDRKAEADACAQLALTAANSVSELAFARIERMKVMRFASEEAMKAYTDETERLQMEAIRLDNINVSLSKRYGMPGIELDPGLTEDPTDESAAAAIAAADACAAPLLT